MDYSEYQKLGTGKLVQQIENGATKRKQVIVLSIFQIKYRLKRIVGSKFLTMQNQKS